MFRKYFKIWLLLTQNSFQSFTNSRFSAILFLLGKVIRFGFYMLFLIIIVSKTGVLAGYNINQILLFYLTFNFIDSSTQTLFREVYRFRQQLISGNFDLMLLKPINILFRCLFGWTDLWDLVTLTPFLIFICFLMARLPHISLGGVILYFVLLVNSLLIAMSFHIMVLSLGILTSEIDNAVMIYRDFTGLGKVPINIFGEPFRFIFTFIIPVGIMMSMPVQTLLGQLHLSILVTSVMITLLFLGSSLLLWNFSLKKYTSYAS